MKKKIKASITSVKTSPQKVIRLSSSLYDVSPINALQKLRYSNLKVARVLEKLIVSAISNAENNFSIDPTTLIIKSFVVGKARSIKRFVARGRGKSNVISKHYANIFLELEESSKTL